MAQNTKTVLNIPLEEARDRISKQLDSGDKLLAAPIENQDQLATARADYASWRDYTRKLLRQILSTEELAEEFYPKNAPAGAWAHPGRPPSLQEEISDFQATLRTYRDRLASIYGQLELFPIVLPEQQDVSNPVEIIEHIIQRFHIVARQIRQRYNNRETLDVSDEYDVQDLLHALLKLFFDDIRPEDWTPSYAGGASIVDFILKAEQVVIEVKKTREGLGAKQVGDQLLKAIGRYRSRPDCKTLICFVYDPDGYIGNPIGLENDLSKPVNGMLVKVIIAPKGS
jgi:hypothetical protein